MTKKNTAANTQTVDFAHPETTADIDRKEEHPPVKADDTPVVFATSRAFAALGDSGLRLESAVGEFIDNAVEAHATQIDLKIKYTTSSTRSNAVKYIEELAVIDNGTGMGYDAVKSCLALGASIRPQDNGKKGIGRYGMGLPAAATSLAWRVEVYSRTDPESDFLYVYLDFENRDETDIYLPLPRQVSAQDSVIAEYAGILEGSSGTIVVLRHFKAKRTDSQLSHYIGRTYRKFISQGTEIFHNGAKVYLHDPLYMDGPTRFDAAAEKKGEPWDPKATPYGSGEPFRLSLEIPGTDGKMADVEIQLTKLPQPWYTDGRQPGSKNIYRDRRIHENEGVSILREGREVYYGALSNVIGRKDDSKPKDEDLDRWWGCEISFPAELDSHFEMRFIKNDIIPSESLRNKIYDSIMVAIRSLREIIRSDRAAQIARRQQSKAQEDQDPIKDAEIIYRDAAKRLPKNMTREERTQETEKKRDEVLEKIVKKRLDPGKYQDAEKRAKKKAELSSLPLVVNPNSNFFNSALFYPEYHIDQIVLNLNVKHPFYVDILEPLLSTLSAEDEGKENANVIVNDFLIYRNEMKNAIFLLLFSLAKGEQCGLSEANTDYRDELEDQLNNFREVWGRVLATTMREVRKKRGE